MSIFVPIYSNRILACKEMQVGNIQFVTGAPHFATDHDAFIVAYGIAILRGDASTGVPVALLDNGKWLFREGLTVDFGRTDAP